MTICLTLACIHSNSIRSIPGIEDGYNVVVVAATDTPASLNTPWDSTRSSSELLLLATDMCNNMGSYALIRKPPFVRSFVSFHTFVHTHYSRIKFTKYKFAHIHTRICLILISRFLGWSLCIEPAKNYKSIIYRSSEFAWSWGCRKHPGLLRSTEACCSLGAGDKTCEITFPEWIYSGSDEDDDGWNSFKHLMWWGLYIDKKTREE